jgi:CorA-like Mg2+ transporter protein
MAAGAAHADHARTEAGGSCSGEFLDQDPAPGQSQRASGERQRGQQPARPHRSAVPHRPPARRPAALRFYGMNVPYPGFDKVWGFVASIGSMIVIAIILYIVFKKKDWI